MLETLHSAIVAEESKQRVQIGLWKIPAATDIEATELARAALRNKSASIEQAEVSESIRVDEKTGRSETSRTQSTDLNDTKTAIEPTKNNAVIEKKALVQVKRGEGRVGNAKTVGTGPVSLNLFHQPPYTNGSKGCHGAHGTASPHDRLSSEAVLDYGMFVEIPQFPSPDKSVLWMSILSEAFANLFLHRCIEQSERWACGYVCFLLCVSSEEWRKLSVFVGHSVVYFMFNLLLVCLVKQ